MPARCSEILWRRPQQSTCSFLDKLGLLQGFLVLFCMQQQQNCKAEAYTVKISPEIGKKKITFAGSWPVLASTLAHFFASLIEYCLIGLFILSLIYRDDCVSSIPASPAPFSCECWMPHTDSYIIIITAHYLGQARAKFRFTVVIKQETCHLSTPWALVHGVQ